MHICHATRPTTALAALAFATLSAAATPLQDLQAVLVRDVNARSAEPGSDPEWLTPAGALMFFSAFTDIGEELWATDGSLEGTYLVKDIAPLNSSDPTSLTAIGGTVFFSAYEGTRRQLWKSDGTESGTVRVKDIDPRAELAASGGLLFFVADDGTHGRELWKSDGSEAGTVMVSDLTPGPDSSNILGLVDLDGTLFYKRRIGNSGSAFDLWKSDGTAAGTEPVAEFGPGSNSNISHLTDVDGVLYFSAAIDGDRELWKHDPGTGDTTKIDINPSSGSFPNELTAFDGTLFLRAAVAFDDELWKLDGETPVLVKDIHPSGSSIPQSLTAVESASGSTLFFTADDGVHGRELWKTDGTEAGTVLVADLDPVGDGILLKVFFGGPPDFADVNGQLFFVPSSLTAHELWRSDGTEAGTVKLDVSPTGDSLAQWVTDFNGTAYFTARRGLGELSTDDLYFGVDLWKSDGTPEGTVNFPISPERTLPSVVVPQRVVGTTLYFTANDAEILLSDVGDTPTDNELWKTDGTEAGTLRVADINPTGSSFSSPAPYSFEELDGTLLFMSDDGVTGRELWKSDGSEAGTLRLKDIHPGVANGNPLELTTVGNSTFFVADDGVNGRELWKTDGTEVGTVLVADIAAGAASSLPSELIEFEGALFFRADDRLVGSELWKSDGTVAGTVLVKDIQPGASGTSLRDFTVLDDTLFFSSNSRLWKSDGSGIGTDQIVGVSSVSGLVAYDGSLYFVALGDAAGRELWRHDPATNVTERVTDIHPSGHSNPEELTGFDGALFFSADDGVDGRALWKYDPRTGISETIVGFEFPTNPRIENLTAVSGALYFTASDGGPIVKRGRTDLWTSDGTAAGTSKMDLGAGLSPRPEFLTDVGGTLFFRGYRYDVSTELFKLAGTPSLSIASPADGEVITGAEANVEGLATDDGDVVSVIVNGVEADLTPTGSPTDPAEVSFSALIALVSGANEIAAVATDDDGNASTVTIVVESELGGSAPDCSGAAPSLASLWPPNHKLVSIAILGVTDGDGNSAVDLEITAVTSDEPVPGPGKKHHPDAVIVGDGTVLLRAERFGFESGRVYEIQFTASNEAGECTGSVQVAVPHDQSGDPAIDDGQIYDATGGQ